MTSLQEHTAQMSRLQDQRRALLGMPLAARSPIASSARDPNVSSRLDESVFAPAASRFNSQYNSYAAHLGPAVPRDEPPPGPTLKV